MAASVKILHCVLCEDVRQENTGKQIIIGVYPNGIILKLIPGTAVVGLWLPVIWQGEGTLKIEIQILNPKGVQAGKTEGTATAIFQGDSSSINFNPFQFAADMEGYYTVQWRPEGGNWQLLIRFPVVQNKA